MLDRLREFFKHAGAADEESTDRNGLLSYNAESHSLACGIGIGWLAVVTGDLALLGVLIPAITSGLRAKNKEFGKILTDVKEEPHYALLGVVIGGLLGLPFGIGSIALASHL